MRHYEMVLLIHPDRSDLVPQMVERYQQTIEQANGHVHRQEDWGRRQLAYPIKKLHKAHYLLMNFECDAKTLQAIKDNLRFNDAVLRELILVKEHAITEPSVMMASKEDNNEKGA